MLHTYFVIHEPNDRLWARQRHSIRPRAMAESQLANRNIGFQQSCIGRTNPRNVLMIGSSLFSPAIAKNFLTSGLLSR